MSVKVILKKDHQLDKYCDQKKKIAGNSQEAIDES